MLRSSSKAQCKGIIGAILSICVTRGRRGGGRVKGPKRGRTEGV